MRGEGKGESGFCIGLSWFKLSSVLLVEGSAGLGFSLRSCLERSRSRQRGPAVRRPSLPLLAKYGTMQEEAIIQHCAKYRKNITTTDLKKHHHSST